MRQLIGTTTGFGWLVAAVGMTVLPGLVFAEASSPCSHDRHDPNQIRGLLSVTP
jgi:hypothetical protein